MWKSNRRSWAAVLLVLAASLSMTAPAAERNDYTRIDPGKHAAGEILNAQVQAVIDSSWPYVTLDSGAVCTTAFVRTQDIFAGYPDLATYVISLDSGMVSVRFEEYYWSQMEAVGHADTANYVLKDFDGANQWTVAAPLDSLGEWSADVPIHGGRKFRLFVTAHADNTMFRHGIQTMR